MPNPAIELEHFLSKEVLLNVCLTAAFVFSCFISCTGMIALVEKFCSSRCHGDEANAMLHYGYRKPWKLG